jgi:uncharacterized membrane protein YhhN
VSARALVALTAAGLFGLLDWIAVARERKPLEYIAKPATLAALLVAAVLLDPASATQRSWFVAALALSLVGDVFLMLPSDRFVPGLVAFLLGHLAYIAGFWQVVDAPWLAVAALVVLLAAGAPLLARIVRGARTAGQQALVAPVLVYAAVISAMVAAAIASRQPLAIAGAALFYASDLTIAWRRFVRPFAGAGLVIIVTYHVAQALLVASLV